MNRNDRNPVQGAGLQRAWLILVSGVSIKRPPIFTGGYCKLVSDQGCQSRLALPAGPQVHQVYRR